jgi:PTH1 family peptidyl-tRNA hydrolase
VKVIVGLGNPGAEYAFTPHNVGFMAVDVLARRYDAVFREQRRFHAETATVVIGEEEVLLVKPQTFMNNSGETAGAILRYNKIESGDLIALYDDANLEFGRIRVRGKGRPGGHNGVASLIQHVGCGSFSRVRIGIGRAPGASELVKHVLSSFPTALREEVAQMVEEAADAACCVILSGVTSAMNSFNAAPKPLPKEIGDGAAASVQSGTGTAPRQQEKNVEDI